MMALSGAAHSKPVDGEMDEEELRVFTRSVGKRQSVKPSLTYNNDFDELDRFFIKGAEARDIVQGFTDVITFSEPVGLKSDRFKAPFVNPFSIFWQPLLNFGDKHVMIKRSSRSRKRVLVVVGDRIDSVVTLFKAQLMYFYPLMSLTVAAGVYQIGGRIESWDVNIRRLFFFFYPSDKILLMYIIILLAINLILAAALSGDRGTPLFHAGRMHALQHLAPVRGFHFMVSYNWECQELALSLGSALSQTSLNVWLDLYRLDNAHPLQATIYGTAREVLFIVVLLSPKYLSSVNCCIEMQAAVSLGPARSVFFVDPSFQWPALAGAAAGAGRQALVAALRARGLRVAETLRELVRHVDKRMLCLRGQAAEPVREWWLRQPLAHPISLYRPNQVRLRLWTGPGRAGPVRSAAPLPPPHCGPGLWIGPGGTSPAPAPRPLLAPLSPSTWR
jgi:hypothetical protein